MNQSLLVTISCITYNHEPYIRECLEGFVMQKTNFKFEAIVHDDASTDGTAAIIAEYAEKYPDIIKPLYETENQYSKRDGSLGRIMNAHMRGKYIAMCEGDDYWIDPYKLQKQVDFMEANPEYGLCYTDFNVLDCINNNEMKYSLIQSGQSRISLDFFTHLTTMSYIAPCSWVYKKDVYTQLIVNGDKLKKVVDGTFVIALEFFLHSKIAYMPFTSCVYRICAGSATHMESPIDMYRYKKGMLELIMQYSRFIPESDIRKKFVNSYAFPVLKRVIKNRFFKEVFVIMNYIYIIKYGNKRGLLFPFKYLLVVLNTFAYLLSSYYFLK